jgi:hypothetical protein
MKENKLFVLLLSQSFNLSPQQNKNGQSKSLYLDSFDGAKNEPRGRI